jgi:D-glycero-D-manno-heptose 1,7-bisphosphate phosphatase
MRGCVFLDRDGVINRTPPAGQYVLTWDDFRFIPESVDWIRLFNALQFLVIVITNQRAVARGLLAPSELEAIHERMKAALLASGARIDDVFCCPHEESVCECRKPKPGLVLQAQRKWDIDLTRSLLIGDSESDRMLARSCGLRFVEVRDGRIVGGGELEAEVGRP